MRVCAVVLATGLCFGQLYAHAQLVSVEASVGGETRTAVMPIFSRPDADYVSLQALAEQFGALYNVFPTRMSIDLGGVNAWVQIEDRRVNAIRIFELLHPIIRADGEMLIAKSDVETFFDQAFNVPVRVLDLTTSQPLLEPVAPPDAEQLAPPADVASLPGITSAAPLDPPGQRPVNVIVLDAGHGGYDGGIQATPELNEKGVALAVTLAARELLKSALPDKTILLTRSEDLSLSLVERANTVSKANADLVVSIHIGNAANPAVGGTAVFYPATPSRRPQAASRVSRQSAGVQSISPQSGALARVIGRTLAQETKMKLRGIQPAPLRLFTLAPTPGVLIEIGCFSNAEDQAFLATEEGVQQAARGVASGIQTYIEEATLRTRPLAAIEPSR